MTRQRALRLAREWAQSHKCTLRDGEAAEYHSMFAAMLEESMPNEPLTLEELEELSQTYTNWVWLVFPEAPQKINCWERACKSYALYARGLYGKTWLAYRRPPEGEEDT